MQYQGKYFLSCHTIKTTVRFTVLSSLLIPIYGTISANILYMLKPQVDQEYVVWVCIILNKHKDTNCQLY